MPCKTRVASGGWGLGRPLCALGLWGLFSEAHNPLGGLRRVGGARLGQSRCGKVPRVSSNTKGPFGIEGAVGVVEGDGRKTWVVM